jgi:transposase
MTEPKNTPSYPSDLTDEEWGRVAPLLPAHGKIGRPRTLDMRQVVNALLYLAATGCKWRELPAHFPKRASVRTYHDDWRRDGTWEKLCALIRPRDEGISTD